MSVDRRGARPRKKEEKEKEFSFQKLLNGNLS
jgi:hypothetical protein